MDFKFGKSADADKSDETVRDAAENHGDNSPEANQARLDTGKFDPDQTMPANAPPVYQGFSSDKSAADLGVDLDKDRHEGVETVLAEVAAANQGVLESETLYSSHPIQNLRVGPFVFEGTVLRLKGDALSAFEGLLDSLPLSERTNIRKIDSSRVDEIVKQRAAAIQGIGGTEAREAMEQLRREHPVVGTEAIPTAHMNRSQQDNNEEVPLPVEGHQDGESAEQR